MNIEDVQSWLDQYGKAWVKGDPAQIVTLFSEGATYREKPFDDPMTGRQAIRHYWQEGAADAQTDVTFASQVWAINGNEAAAGWQASLRRIKDGSRIELDGSFRLSFAEGSDPLVCESLEEWWHRREVDR